MKYMYGRLCILVFFSLCFVQEPEAAQWVLLSENVRNDAFYIDLESISRTGDRVRYRRKVQFGLESTFSETNALQEIDCKGKRMRNIEMTVLYTDGRTETLVSDAWMDIEPDTVFAVFHEVVCPQH